MVNNRIGTGHRERADYGREKLFLMVGYVYVYR